MEETLSYVLVTPYTIAKSRTGGVFTRLLSRPEVELVGAQIIAPDGEFVKNYAAALREETSPNEPHLIADYVERNLGPSGGRRHRSLLLIFRGQDPCATLVSACGHIYPEHQGNDSLCGETIRDTYADLIVSPEDPAKITYFEPAVITPRNQAWADKNLALFAQFLKGQDNVIQNISYPDPSKIEQTLVIIKPDNWQYASSKPGTIISMFSRAGLRIVAIKVHRFSLAQALEFYGSVEAALKEKLAPSFGRKAKALLEREFNVSLSEAVEQSLTGQFGIECAWDQFAQIVQFMSGSRPDGRPPEEAAKPGKVKCMILLYEGENAVKKIRDVLGPTDPLKAPGGTVRRDFGSNVMVNTAHASDSAENARREMGIIRINENDTGTILNEYLKSVLIFGK